MSASDALQLDEKKKQKSTPRATSRFCRHILFFGVHYITFQLEYRLNRRNRTAVANGGVQILATRSDNNFIPLWSLRRSGEVLTTTDEITLMFVANDLVASKQKDHTLSGWMKIPYGRAFSLAFQRGMRIMSRVCRFHYSQKDSFGW